jgi:hypothetical protein
VSRYGLDDSVGYTVSAVAGVSRRGYQVLLVQDQLIRSQLTVARCACMTHQNTNDWVMIWIFRIVGSTLDNVQKVQNELVVHGHCEQHKSV